MNKKPINYNYHYYLVKCGTFFKFKLGASISYYSIENPSPQH